MSWGDNTLESATLTFCPTEGGIVVSRLSHLCLRVEPLPGVKALQTASDKANRASTLSPELCLLGDRQLSFTPILNNYS